MKCPKCGNEVLSTDSHCSSCGVHLATAFQQKAATAKPKATPTGKVCPKCGHPVKSTDIACGYCTHYLGSRPISTTAHENVYATLALIFAIFGSTIIGFILGMIGLSRAHENYGDGRGKSIAAIIISIVGTIFLFIALKNSIIDLINTLSKLYYR